MKWYDVCNKISLLLHALVSAVGYFLIEAISRHSFTEAWDFMTGRPLVFAYNAATDFYDIPDRVPVQEKMLSPCVFMYVLAFAGDHKRRNTGYPCNAVYRSGSPSPDRWNGSAGKISSQVGSDRSTDRSGIFCPDSFWSDLKGSEIQRKAEIQMEHSAGTGRVPGFCRSDTAGTGKKSTF